MSRAEGRGLFITLEGVDGAGKSTHLEAIAARLRTAGRQVLVTREPGGTPLAEKLRALLLADAVDPTPETLLMFAARADHVARVIRPALERGVTVVCDRFTDATIAYQGGGKGVARAVIERLAEVAHAGLKPDLTLVFDCNYDVSRTRLAGAGRPLDRFERETQAFFERVRTAYLELGREDPARVRVIDGSRSLPKIKKQLDEILGSL